MQLETVVQIIPETQIKADRPLLEKEEIEALEIGIHQYMQAMFSRVCCDARLPPVKSMTLSFTRWIYKAIWRLIAAKILTIDNHYRLCFLRLTLDSLSLQSEP